MESWIFFLNRGWVKSGWIRANVNIMLNKWTTLALLFFVCLYEYVSTLVSLTANKLMGFVVLWVSASYTTHTFYLFIYTKRYIQTQKLYNSQQGITPAFPLHVDNQWNYNFLKENYSWRNKRIMLANRELKKYSWN